jgi:hypothetical protein
MIQPTAQERSEALTRLYEDIRRAMNNHEYDRAARLSLQLAGELGDDEFLKAQGYPICLECNGYAEVVDPEHPEKKTMCVSAPGACYGNRTGRMTPEQYTHYLDAKLAPRMPTVTERVQHPTEPGGEVPALPPDSMRPTPAPVPYVYNREQVIAFNKDREARGEDPLPVPEQPTLIQS